MIFGAYSHGFHDWLMDEAELGTRAAMALDDEAAGWSALDNLSYTLYVIRELIGAWMANRPQKFPAPHKWGSLQNYLMVRLGMRDVQQVNWLLREVNRENREKKLGKV